MNLETRTGHGRFGRETRDVQYEADAKMGWIGKKRKKKLALPGEKPNVCMPPAQGCRSRPADCKLTGINLGKVPCSE
jgi:hypothetical protein